MEKLSGKSYAFSVCDVNVEEFKILISEETLAGKKIWAAYNYTKSNILNHRLPYFKIGSGEEVDDDVERLRMHAWSYRANRTIRANNKRIIEAGTNDVEDLKMWQVAPEGTTGNVMLELPI